MIQKVFIWTSPLPLLVFWGLSIYVNQYEGWGQWAAAPILFIPILLSFLMGVWGVVLIRQARKLKMPTANLWFSTLTGASLLIFFLAKAIVLEVTKSFG